MFKDYETFGCVNKAYSDLTSKSFDLVNKVAPTKSIRVKNKTNEWFDGGIAEKIATRDKLFRKFKKSNARKAIWKFLWKWRFDPVQSQILLKSFCESCRWSC